MPHKFSKLLLYGVASFVEDGSTTGSIENACASDVRRAFFGIPAFFLIQLVVGGNLRHPRRHRR